MNQTNEVSYCCLRRQSGDLNADIATAWSYAHSQGRGPKRIVIHRSLPIPAAPPRPVDHLPCGGPQPYELWIEVTS